MLRPSHLSQSIELDFVTRFTNGAFQILKLLELLRFYLKSEPNHNNVDLTRKLLYPDGKLRAFSLYPDTVRASAATAEGLLRDSYRKQFRRSGFI